MGRPRRRTSRPGSSQAGGLRTRPLRAADLSRLEACGPACGLAALDHDALLEAIARHEVTASVATDAATDDLAADAPLVVLAAPAFAARCAWIPGEPSADAWVVLGLRTGDVGDASVGRMLLRAGVAGMRNGAAGARVQAIEAWAGRADPCEASPAQWRELGFSVVRPHPVRPRVRIDLRALPVWRDGAVHAWGRVAGMRGRPAAVPEAQRSSRSSASRS